MTQEVQPLTWQKRTNLEEHQQFFSKINEIIGNLAPTVDEAEAAIAQATQAIATANAASASADAASQQAQTAATTVAGYNARLTTAEGDIDTLDGRISTAESKNTQQDASIATLQTADSQNVKLSGNQNITGIKTVPTTDTGTRDTQIANGTRIQNDLDAYVPMIRNTGNQMITGLKTFSYTIGGYLMPVVTKTPENAAGYLRIFKIPRVNSVLEMTVSTPTAYYKALCDLRTDTCTINVDVHGTDRISPTDVIVCITSSEFYFFIKYPQNRKLIVKVDNYCPLFSNEAGKFSNIDNSIFTRTLESEPEVGGEFIYKFVSKAIS